MTDPILIVERKSQQIQEEKVWGESLLNLLYGQTICAHTLGRFLLKAFFRWPVVSSLIGLYYDSTKSRSLIQPFCDRFNIKLNECSLSCGEFKSFNDFFTRRLKPENRPQDPDPDALVMPADGRYRFFHNLQFDLRLPVKGEYLDIKQLLRDPHLASKYHGGTAVLCRLCPADCHRFYFPCDGFASAPKLIHGPLYSVNPIATKRFPWIFWTNRRVLTTITNKNLGVISYLEIGATNCGSIVQEFPANSTVQKGQEKGYFKLGGSAIIILFEKETFELAPDLLELEKTGHEIFCQIGQTLGYGISK
jgi:phosphatidylserine decarboxylase